MMVDRRTMDRPKGLGLASVLVAHGFAVLNMDFRGHGESVLRTRRSFSFDDIVRNDVPALVFALRDRFPDLPRFLVGHSLGGIVVRHFVQEIGDALAHESTSCDEHFHGWRCFW